MPTVNIDADLFRGSTMDPNAAWQMMVNALESANWRVVQTHANDLLDWLHMGGFPPDISEGRVTDRYWNRQIAIYACKLARLIARRRIRG